MGKKLLIAVLCFVAVVAIYVDTKPSQFASPSIPATPLEESICEKVEAQFGDCTKILMYDARSHLAFAEINSGIIPVLTNQEFTAFKKFIYPTMDFNEFKEEKVERGYIDWRVGKDVQKDFSVIYGFAEDEAKTIVINSEGNIQPNRFLVGDNLWVWYATLKKDKVTLPVEVTVYNADGQMIYGGDAE